MATATQTQSIPIFNCKQAFTSREEMYVVVFRDILRRGAFIQLKDVIEFDEHDAAARGL